MATAAVVLRSLPVLGGGCDVGIAHSSEPQSLVIVIIKAAKVVAVVVVAVSAAVVVGVATVVLAVVVVVIKTTTTTTSTTTAMIMIGITLIRILSTLTITRLLIINCLIGLVVKASASKEEDPGFESRLRRDFFGVESCQ